MFFGDDRGVQKIKAKAPYGWVEHSWYWAYNWWVRDPVFRQAALIKRDGVPMIEYWGNSITEREAGNPLHPLMLRMRQEISRSVLIPHDPRSPENPIYPNAPFTAWDDTNRGAKEPFEYYPVFGHLSMLWYDNPVYWADSSDYSRQIWTRHFKEKFGVEIADPASHRNDLVRREWTRFWADAYGRYLDDYYRHNQENVQKTAVPETTKALNGKLHLTVGMNASTVSSPWGAQALYLFAKHKVSDFPGLLVEYYPILTSGKYAPIMKFSMAAMRGRPTGGAETNALHEAEALALNGANAYMRLPPRTKAYIQFQYDNRDLLTNALQGNRVGVLYNVRTGLVTETLVGAYELGQQLDELGVPYDVLVEEDLSPKNARFLSGYAAILVPGGEFNEEETEGLTRYVKKGGHLALIGDVELEQPQYVNLGANQGQTAFSPDIPLARAFGHDGFRDAGIAFGKGTLTVCEPQVVTNARLRALLDRDIPATWRLADPKQGLVAANVLVQPRCGDALIVGLVNYSGQPQRDVVLLLPKDLRPQRVGLVSPDGYAALLEPVKLDSGLAVTVPELYQYAAVILGKNRVVEAALATIQPKLSELAGFREPLRKAEPPKEMLGAARPEDVPAGRQQARLRHGTNDSGTFIVLDALAPEQVRAGEPFRVEMKVRSTGTHYTGTATFDYWRVRLVNVATGEEVRTKPPGTPALIDGVAVQEVREGSLVPASFKANELTGKTLVAETTIDRPGQYQVSVDYLFNNIFLQGDPGPRAEPAFPGDRPDGCWGYPGRPLKKLYLKHKLPRLVIQVSAITGRPE
jgi:hypothetical protein